MADPQTATVFDPMVARALWAGVASFTLFAVAKFVEYVQGRKARYESARQLRIGLYTEVLHNVEELEHAYQNAGTSKDILQAKQTGRLDEFKTIHVVFARNMRFFDQLFPNLLNLNPEVVDATVRFYSQLDEIYAMAEGFSAPSFQLISEEGRLGMVDGFAEKLAKTASLGHIAMKEFEQQFPNEGFVRKNR